MKTNNSVAIITGWVMLLQGFLLFAGLYYNITFLISIIKGPAGMNPLTAICFIAAGISLLIISDESCLSNLSSQDELNKDTLKSVKLRVRIYYTLNYIIIIIGALRLIEFISGIPVSLAHLISEEWVTKNIMAPNTAFNFILIGFSMLFIRRTDDKFISKAQYLALVSGLIAFLTLIGYFYSLFSFNLLNVFLPPMALNTSILFILLTIGILSLKKEDGFMYYLTHNSTVGKTARIVMFFAFIVLIALGWFSLYGENNGFFDNATGTAIYIWLIISASFIVTIISIKKLIEEEVLRKLSEVRIAESELKLRAIIDNSPSAIHARDLEGKYILVNKKTEELHGKKSGECIGKNLFELSPGTPREILEEFYSRDKIVINSGIAMEFEEPVTINGKKYVLLTQRFPLFDLNNNIYATGGISTDITYRKYTEEKLSALNNQLAASNKELESFSYSVSHDLRAPLRHIIGFGEKLHKVSEGKLGDEEKRVLNKILASSNKMAVLIDDLLTYSRLGRTELYVSEVSINDLVDEYIKDYHYSEGEKEINWIIHRVPVVKADRFQLQIVINNLLSNAVKYTGKSDIRNIEAGGYKNETGTVVFIKDTGCGFDTDYKDKLFGVFQRLHHENEFEGTGIGLATVKNIINRHKGDVWAESELGKGSAFYFLIPD